MNLSSIKNQRERYWAAFFEKLPSDNLELKVPRVYDSHYRDFHMGITGCYIRASRRVKPPSIYASFVMKGSSQDFFHSLIKQQSEIEKYLGEEIYLHEDIQNEKQIYLGLEYCDVTDETDWSDQHQWLVTKFENLIEVFRPRIEKYNSY